jgi:D-glycero-D-manno-heptose 1,7-bisphosphate phosphatase
MSKKALFLDRDGVINVDHGYVYRQDDFDFIDGIFTLSKEASIRGYEIIVVTNQAGIGKGYYSEKNFEDLTTWMLNIFFKNGAPIKEVYFCPNHPDGIGKYKKMDNRRKPGPGMLNEAKINFDLNMEESILVGNNISDINAGLSAGVGTNILFSQGSKYDTLQHNVVSNLTDVINFL